MNVWIFALSAVFTPVIEPLGLMTPALESLPIVEPAPVSAPDVPDVQAPSVLTGMRYPGLERMLAKLDASE